MNLQRKKDRAKERVKVRDVVREGGDGWERWGWGEVGIERKRETEEERGQAAKRERDSRRLAG